MLFTTRNLPPGFMIILLKSTNRFISSQMFERYTNRHKSVKCNVHISVSKFILSCYFRLCHILFFSVKCNVHISGGIRHSKEYYETLLT